MKDTKFITRLFFLTILNIAAFYVLNFVSFDKKIQKSKSQQDNFFIKLSQIEGSFDTLDFYKYKPKKALKYTSVKKSYPDNKKDTKFKKKYLAHNAIKIKKSVDICSKYEAKFKKTNSYQVALKLSRLYYMKKKYKKSLKWAMIANELNNKDDGSWILFAKTKLKMGEKDIAKKALLTYTKRYNSKRVKKLLDRISS